MDFVYTRHQVPRGTLADAEKFNTMYLIKQVQHLRPTYQIRLLAFRAVTEGKKLVLLVPKDCAFSAGLNELVTRCDGKLQRQDT
jgi:hypothetical protein